MSHWLLPLGSLQTRGGNFSGWFYSHHDSIRKSDKGIGMGFTGMRSGWYVIFLFRPDFLFVWVCYPTEHKKVSGRTSRATCSPGMKSRQLNNTASGCGRASLGRKHFGLSILFQSSVWLFSLPNSDPSRPSPASPALPEGRVQPERAMLPFGHAEARQDVILFPHHAHSTCCKHSLTAKRDLILIWAIKGSRQTKDVTAELKWIWAGFLEWNPVAFSRTNLQLQSEQSAGHASEIF